jgi:hypothetical protein
MGRKSKRARFRPEVFSLEPRALLSRGVMSAMGSVRPHVTVQPSDFHHNYGNMVAYRISVSASSTALVNDAFQAFIQNYLHIPVADQGKVFLSGFPTGSGTSGTVSSGVTPVGTIPNPPTLANFIAQLSQQVTTALTTLQITKANPQPSAVNAPKFSPSAFRALVPFAQAAIAQLQTDLTVNPPIFNSQGMLTNAAPIKAVQDAFTKILNAVAENSVHPKLFATPSDFYINPLANFTIPQTSAPAEAAPNFFLLGPGGVPLPR